MNHQYLQKQRDIQSHFFYSVSFTVFWLRASCRCRAPSPLFCFTPAPDMPPLGRSRRLSAARSRRIHRRKLSAVSSAYGIAVRALPDAACGTPVFRIVYTHTIVGALIS
jgi:hypothetical protein